MGSKKKLPTARDNAISSGRVPKARNAYALFTQDETKKGEYIGKDWKECAKIIALRWKALPQSELASYKNRSFIERRQQRCAMVEHGLSVPSAVVGTKSGCTLSTQRLHHTPRVSPPPDQVCFGRYALCQNNEIGRGSYGKVVIAKEQSERRVAIKIFTEVHEVKHEVAILSHLGAHRCILPVLDHSAEPPSPYMVMPYVHGGNVMHLLRYLSLIHI